MVRLPGSPPDKEALAPIRFSIGIAMMNSKAGATTETLLHEADAAMYLSKQQGGDRFSFYSEVDSDQSRKLVAATPS
jgi:GGDEF domain-containing protein